MCIYRLYTYTYIHICIWPCLFSLLEQTFPRNPPRKGLIIHGPGPIWARVPLGPRADSGSGPLGPWAHLGPKGIPGVYYRAHLDMCIYIYIYIYIYPGAQKYFIKWPDMVRYRTPKPAKVHFQRISHLHIGNTDAFARKTKLISEKLI